MKQLLLFSLALLFLVACGNEEAAQPAVDAPAIVEEQPVDDSSEAIDAAAADAAEETLEVVEESAAEPAADEQAIVLAQADVPATPREWQFKEGQNYKRLVPTQPTVGGADKIAAVATKNAGGHQNVPAAPVEIVSVRRADAKPTTRPAQ